jgi:hypothetical protein
VLGFLVDRIQAINMLQIIASKIPEIDPKSISIMEGEPSNPSKIGCRINFKGLSSNYKEKIKLIVKSYRLAVLDNEPDLEIYTPLQHGLAMIRNIL